MKFKIILLYFFLFQFCNVYGNIEDVNITSEIIYPREENNFRRICYYANWAPYRTIDPILYPDDIDPNICTHIHYAFAKIDPETLKLVATEEHDMNWTETSQIPLFIRLYGLKRRNFKLKTLLAVGGWSAKSAGFNEATKTYENRSKFINQTIKFLREWNFDGIDLDWEFPGSAEREADTNSKENFNTLVTEFRLAINKESELVGRKKLLLSSAVSADPKVIENGYDVKNLCQQLDYVSVMTYDYHGGTWDDETGLNSPLYGRESKNETFSHTWKNINYTINYWINNGCEPVKLNLGLAAYGRSFTLKNSSYNKVGSPALKGGYPGLFTKEEGMLSYFEICEKIFLKNWTKHWDDVQQSIFTTYDNQWVGFDNQRSIALKVKWALTMSLGGTMLWTLDLDDYSGKFCSEGNFPIANAIKSTYEGYYSIYTTTTMNSNPISTFEIVFNSSSINKLSNETELIKYEALSNFTESLQLIKNSSFQDISIDEKIIETKTFLYSSSLKNVINNNAKRFIFKVNFLIILTILRNIFIF